MRIIEIVLTAAERISEVSRQELMMRTRKRRIVDVRHVAMKILREHDLTFEHVASVFNLKHSTAIVGINDVDYCKPKKQLYNKIKTEVEKELNSINLIEQ